MDRFPGGVLLERDAELASLDRVLETARAGAGSVAVVKGRPGTGKTALLGAARERARAAGMTVRSARAGVLEREHPFGVARQLLGPANAAAPASGEGSWSAGELLFDTLERLYRELAGIAGQGPLLVCVDDLQWADLESLRLCAYLAARIEPLPAALILAMRPAETEREAELLAAIMAGASTLSPAPLSYGGVAVFVRAVLDASVEPEFAAACAHASGGNPFLLGELVRTVRSQRIAPVASSASLVEHMTPDGVANAVLVRLAGVSPGARALAGALAVLGGSAELGEAAALAGLDTAAAASGADELTRASVLEASGRLEFLHPLVGNVVYADVSRAQREAMHAAAARLLDGAANRDIDRVAAHLLAVAPARDPWTAERLLAAGQQALARGACDTAVAYLRRALAEPPPPDERAGLLVSLAQAEAVIGSTSAVERLERALELITEPPRRAQVRQSLGRLFLLRGEFALAGEEARRALDELAGDERTPLARALLADYLVAATFHPALHAAEDPRALALITEAMSGDLPNEPQLCAFVAGSMALSGAAPARVRDVARAAIKDVPTGDGTAQGFASAMLTGALLAIEDYELAAEVGQSIARHAQRTGSVVARALANEAMAGVRFTQGRLPEAAEHGEAALELLPAGWDMFSTAALTLALTEVWRGRLAAAQAALHVGERQQSAGPARAFFLQARAHLAMAQDRPDHALADFQAAGRHYRETYGVEHPTFLPWRPFAALAAARLGDHALATELAESGLDSARPIGTARPLGVALTAAGQIAGGEQGIDLLSEAVAVLAPSPARLEHADALVALGTVLRRAGRPTDARQPLREGLQIARTCGATPLAARAHQELLASGLRPRKTLRGGPDALTPAEQRVATMAANGLTNRQIAHTLVLSTRTIEAHLARTYTKLGVNSRKQLATALHDRIGTKPRG
jgi:DNA-binding CsgD family transcriptional regulator